MIMWLKNKDGQKPEDVFDKDQLASWLDTIISTNIPENCDEYRKKFLPNIEQCYEEELCEKSSKFQNHGHTFRYDIIKIDPSMNPETVAGKCLEQNLKQLKS